ncbi:MAG: type II toxin-antitoxin system RelE/ParE family toxin [Myxococcota bacterium]
MTRRIRWTNTAVERLAEIEEYIEQDSPQGASNFLVEVIELVETLSEHANRGRHLPELWAESIRELIYGNFRVVYRVRPKEVEILTVFEGHRLLRDDEFE